MLNRKPDANSVLSRDNVTLQQKLKLSVVSDGENRFQNTNEGGESEQPFIGNVAIRLTAAELENYNMAIENPRDPSPEVIGYFKQYLKNKA